MDEVMRMHGRDAMNKKLINAVETDKPDVLFCFLFTNELKKRPSLTSLPKPGRKHLTGLQMTTGVSLFIPNIGINRETPVVICKPVKCFRPGFGSDVRDGLFF